MFGAPVTRCRRSDVVMEVMKSIPIDPVQPSEEQIVDLARRLCEQEHGTDHVDEIEPSGKPRWHAFRERAIEIIVEKNGRLNRF